MQNFKEYLKENEIQDIIIYNKNLVHGKLKKQYPDIKGDFDCSNREIITLKFAPKYVGGNFYCYNTNITSLEFAPQSVGHDFSCFGTKITTLEFAPQYVGRSFGCSDTKITSLKGIGKDYLKEVRGEIYLKECHHLKSSMLGIMLVKELQEIYFDNKEVQDIFNRHLKGDKDILDCQEELITNGLKEYAKL